MVMDTIPERYNDIADAVHIVSPKLWLKQFTKITEDSPVSRRTFGVVLAFVAASILSTDRNIFCF